MLIGRVIQGAAGGIFPLAFGIIRDEFPRERVAGGIGLMSALLGVGGGAGVVLAGPIVDHLSYHYLFWLPLIPIVLATVADPGVRAGVADPRPGPRELGRHGPDVDRARRRADRRQRNGDLALALGQDDRPASLLGVVAARVLGAERVALRSSARRHADDADPRRLDDEHRRAPARLRHVLVVHPAAAISSRRRRDAGYGFGASVTQAGLFLVPHDARDADRRRADRPARAALRVEAAAARRRAVRDGRRS